VSDKELVEETSGAKALIEDAIGAPVTLFAYPFGSYDAWDPRVRYAVANAGFDGAFTSIYGANGAKRDPFLLRRSRVSWAEDIPAFGRMMNGGYDWLATIQWLQARRTLLHRDAE
jgi:peptidoglycan/xylan/chitin deacetylase (PgdA/CDA1 family)